MKEGYRCWVEDNIVCLNKYQHRAINAVNSNRWTDYLCVYNKQGTTTGTNKWGYEVQIDSNGIALHNPEYKGNHKVPNGGWVLSGHGKSGQWIKKYIAKGTKVVNKGSFVQIQKLS